MDRRTETKIRKVLRLKRLLAERLTGLLTEKNELDYLDYLLIEAKIERLEA